jgi:hypothetical protein
MSTSAVPTALRARRCTASSARRWQLEQTTVLDGRVVLLKYQMIA